MASDSPWELSAYELQREPHAVREGHIVMPRAALNSFLKCPVCLSVLADSMTVMECLHHFCGDCISKSLRWGKKECPTCRTGVPSRRSLRANTTIDGIVRVVCPDRTNFEQQQEDMLLKIRSHHNQRALTESIVSGMKDQALLRGARGRFVSAEPRAAGRAKRIRSDTGPTHAPPQTQSLPAAPASPTHATRAAPAASAETNSNGARAGDESAQQAQRSPAHDAQAMLVLLPHPHQEQHPSLAMPYLTTSFECTVAHLIAYVDRYAGSPNADLAIFAEDDDGALQQQPPSETLAQLITGLSPSQRERPFTLFYGHLSRTHV